MAGAPIDEHYTETTRNDTLTVGHGYRGPDPRGTTGTTVRADAVPRARPVSSAGQQGTAAYAPPSFAAPALVLVAALATILGYHSLHLIPNGPLWPTSIPFALIVAPATFGLTWHVDEWRWVSARMVARVSSVLVLVLGLFVAGDQTMVLSRVLGATSLVLALSLMVLVVASEHNRGSSTRID